MRSVESRQTEEANGGRHDLESDQEVPNLHPAIKSGRPAQHQRADLSPFARDNGLRIVRICSCICECLALASGPGAQMMADKRAAFVGVVLALALGISPSR